MRDLLLVLVALMAILLAGCSGDGDVSGPSDGSVIPKLTIAWPERSRAFTAPGSALSAAVILQSAGGTDTSFFINRPTDPSASTQTYSANTPIRRGTYLLVLNFHAGASATGDLVGRASATVSLGPDGAFLRADGTPLGTIGFIGTIRMVLLATGEDVEINETTVLPVSAFDAQGNLMAVSPGSITYRVVDGSQFLRLNQDGTLTGIAEGTATVEAAIDGVTSAPVEVRVVGPGILPRSVNVEATVLLYDSTRQRIWAALPPTVPNGNSVVDIDPVTGSIGTPIQVGSDPTVLALSDDGSTLYVGLRGASAVRRVNLVTRTAGLQFGLDNPFQDQAYATDIAIQPGSTDTIAVTSASPSDSGTYGPAIYDNGVRRPEMLGTYQGTELVWTAPDRIVSYNGSHTGSELFEVAVNESGATEIRSVSQGLAAFSNELLRVGGRLYGSDGSVVDEDTLGRLGQFALPDVGAVFGPAVDAATNRVFFVSFGQGETVLSVFSATTFARLGTSRVDGIPSDGPGNQETSLVLAGSDRLAFQRGDRVYLIDNPPG